MIPLHYKGFVIKHARPSGGKAGKGRNKTTSIQVFKSNMVRKSISYKKNDDNEYQLAVLKARDWIDKLLNSEPTVQVCDARKVK